MVSMLLLETGILGAFLATDLFLFYVFWELMLLPMYFIIGVWGGDAPDLRGRQVRALHAGGLAADAGRDHLPEHLPARQDGDWSFNYADMVGLSIPMGEGFWHSPQMLLFAAFALAFAIKVPVFPLHTWLPDAHTEAPTGGSIILAGVLLKLGTYGLLRFNLPLFPEAWRKRNAAVPDPGGHRDHLRRPRRMGAAGHEEACCLLVGDPHGVHHPRDLRRHTDLDPGRVAPDDQPRAVHRRPLPAGGGDLRPAPHPHDRGLRWPGRGDAPVHRRVS